MTDLQEVFDMVTKQTEPDQDSWKQQEQRQRKTARNRRLGAIAVAAAIITALAIVFAAVRPASEGTPASQPPGTGSASALTPQDVVVVGVDGTILQQVPGLPVDAYEFALSTDGRSIAFVASNGGAPQIGTIGIDGTRLRFLTPERYAATAPAWSPDGSRIAYTALDGNGNRDIYVMDADGSNATRLTTTNVTNTYMKPQWSPDGSHLVYSVNPGPEFSPREEIWTVSAGGGVPTRLTHNDTSDTEPAWGGSPAGSQIAFAREGTIWVMDADGSHAHPVGTQPSSFSPRWSPDGKQIAYLHYESNAGTAILAGEKHSGLPVLSVWVVNAATGYVRLVGPKVFSDRNPAVWLPSSDALLVRRENG